MINKRLIQEVRSSRKYVGWQVACQWAMLLCNIVMVLVWSMLFQRLFFAQAQMKNLLSAVLVAVVCMVVRFVFSRLAAKMGYFAGKEVKQLLREKIYTKLVQMGTSYQEKAATSEMVQLSVEGVEQLETYFGAYLPQFFYSMLAPLTLFAVLGFISLKAAVVLLICVPLIPVSIVFVQKFAKKLLNRYWWQYTSLGDGFLENLQGMTTLKIYRADDRKQQEMNQQAEQFRKVTMRVLTMQLNSITVMGLVAFGGAALGVVLALQQLQAGQVTLPGALCPDCQALMNYSQQRAEKCPFMENKTFCSACPVHCYRPEMRQKIREVMKFSGPRMLLYHPVLALRHVAVTMQEKMKQAKNS